MLYPTGLLLLSLILVSSSPCKIDGVRKCYNYLDCNDSCMFLTSTNVGVAFGLRGGGDEESNNNKNNKKMENTKNIKNQPLKRAAKTSTRRKPLSEISTNLVIKFDVASVCSVISQALKHPIVLYIRRVIVLLFEKIGELVFRRKEVFLFFSSQVKDFHLGEKYGLFKGRVAGKAGETFNILNDKLVASTSIISKYQSVNDKSSNKAKVKNTRKTNPTQNNRVTKPNSTNVLLEQSLKTRLTTELKSFLRNPPPNLKLLKPKKLTSWTIRLTPPPTSIYKDEKFHLRINFPETYPSSPPSVYFLGDIASLPKHEHIYSNGDICLSLLGPDWSPKLTGEGIALSIMSLLTSAKRKQRPMDYAIVKREGRKGGGSQKEWIYHDDRC